MGETFPKNGGIDRIPMQGWRDVEHAECGHLSKRRAWTVAFTLALVLMALQPVRAQGTAPQVVVRGVLFTASSCFFCRQIVDEQLLPLITAFGSQLEILLVDVNTPGGEALYQSALQMSGAQRGVPQLFLGQEVLSGTNIPKELPGLVEQTLAQGGADWPEIPGLAEYLAGGSGDESLTPSQDPGAATAQLATPMAGLAVVRMVLFWSDSCGHCHIVLEQVLPPLQERYGPQLQVLMFEVVSASDVDRLYLASAAYGLSKEQAGVPLVLVGEYALVGSEQIRGELPKLIEDYLDQGGVDFPRIEPLVGVVPTAQPEGDLPTALPAANMTLDPGRDTAGTGGFGLATIVFAGLLAALVYAGSSAWRGFARIIPGPDRFPRWRSVAIVVLCLGGLGVAGYLAFVETQEVPALCGPVGDCNAVQRSEYASLFGLLPLGVVGILGYLAILAAWGASVLGQGGAARLGTLATFGCALVGVLFSLYLTALELWVIQAVCLWCLASAVIMALIFLLSLPPAMKAWGEY